MSDCGDHRWLLVPGGEVNGMMVLGRWVCVNCGFKGPSSRFKCPGKDAFADVLPEAKKP